MGPITALGLMISGLLAASSSVVKTRPKTQQYIARIQPYQTSIGVTVFVLGLWTVVVSVLNIGHIADYSLRWLTYFVAGFLGSALGFLLGFDPINKHLFAKHAKTKPLALRWRAILLSHQIALGWSGIVLGLWCLFASLGW